MGIKQPHQNPPHVSLRSLRTATGLTLDQVATAVSDVLGLDEDKRISRGTVSAIETGVRGASRQMLDAMAIAYGLEPGDITTDYDPRASKIHKAAS